MVILCKYGYKGLFKLYRCKVPKRPGSLRCHALLYAACFGAHRLGTFADPTPSDTPPWILNIQRPENVPFRFNNVPFGSFAPSLRVQIANGTLGSRASSSRYRNYPTDAARRESREQRMVDSWGAFSSWFAEKASRTASRVVGLLEKPASCLFPRGLRQRAGDARLSTYSRGAR